MTAAHDVHCPRASGSAYYQDTFLRGVIVSSSLNNGPATTSPKAAGPSADSLDKEIIDQLHAATLKASDSCFEIKKLCATVLVPTGTLVALFSNRTLGVEVFVAGILVISFFWLADAVGFYYQRRIRVKMDEIWKRRAVRCDEQWDPPCTKKVSPVGAAFNGSMSFYLILAVPVLIGWVLYLLGVIESPVPAAP